MSKTYTSLENKLNQWMTNTNNEVTRVGDLANLLTTADSSIVAAINEVFNRTNLLDSTNPSFSFTDGTNISTIFGGTGGITISEDPGHLRDSSYVTLAVDGYDRLIVNANGTITFKDNTGAEVATLQAFGDSAELSNAIITKNISDYRYARFMGNWSAGTYYKNQIVVHNSNTWACIADTTTTQEPTVVASDWFLLGSAADASGNATFGDTFPTSGIIAGNFHYLTSTPSGLYVYYTDSDGSQWISTDQAAYSFLTDYLPLIGGTLTGPLALEDSATPRIYVDAVNAVQSPGIVFRKNGVNTWGMFSLNTSFDRFGIGMYDSSGVFALSPLTIDQPTGLVRLTTSGSASLTTTNDVRIGHNNANDPVTSGGNDGVTIKEWGHVNVFATALTPVSIGRSDNGNLVAWNKPRGTYVAGISISGSTISYGTTSDYRLKNVFGEVYGPSAIEDVKKIQVHDFEFKDYPGEPWQGFIAHKLQAVQPNAVIGEKDAVDENGNIIPQNVDNAKLVPVLMAALKETIKMVEELKAEVETLKNGA